MEPLLVKNSQGHLLIDDIDFDEKNMKGSLEVFVGSLTGHNNKQNNQRSMIRLILSYMG
jgi:hypothetical protein